MLPSRCDVSFPSEHVPRTSTRRDQRRDARIAAASFNTESAPTSDEIFAKVFRVGLITAYCGGTACQTHNSNELCRGRRKRGTEQLGAHLGACVQVISLGTHDVSTFLGVLRGYFVEIMPDVLAAREFPPMPSKETITFGYREAPNPRPAPLAAARRFSLRNATLPAGKSHPADRVRSFPFARTIETKDNVRSSPPAPYPCPLREHTAAG
jgi:hypothetical protein